MCICEHGILYSIVLTATLGGFRMCVCVIILLLQSRSIIDIKTRCVRRGVMCTIIISYALSAISAVQHYSAVSEEGSHTSQCMRCAARFIVRTEKISFRNAPNPQEFTESDDARIICDVVSSPPATILWKHKGAKIHVAKDGERNASREQEGVRMVPCCSLFMYRPTACMYVHV